jgi:hypothetical protein
MQYGYAKHAASSRNSYSGAKMKKPLALFALFTMTASLALAGPKQTGTVVSQTSVTCGEKKSKKQSLDLTCHQYVVRAGSIDYTVQQAKPEDKALIPLHATVEFKLDKSKMKVKANGESYEFKVISQALANSTPPAPASSTPN